MEFSQPGQWQSWDALRFYDGVSCVWERCYGEGKIVIFRGILGPSLVHFPIVRYILRRLIKPQDLYFCGTDDSVFTLSVGSEKGRLTAVFAPVLKERSGKDIFLKAEDKEYIDLWTGEELKASSDSELRLTIPDGIALLWRK